jgi:hypothetical protein
MTLTDIAIRKAKPGQNPLKIVDGAELYLLLNPNGSCWWRLDHRFAGKRNSISSSYLPLSTSPCRTTVLSAARLLGMNELEME